MLLPAAALCAGFVDTNHDCDLTLHFRSGGTGFADTQFRVYCVAKFERTGALTLTDEFAALSVDFVELDQQGWRELAETLSGYVLSEEIASPRRR